MFQFSRLPSRAYGLGPGFPLMTAGGLPHSGTSGSRPACGSPELFAACCALHRLLLPRHPPRALSSLYTPDLTALVSSLSESVLRRSLLAGPSILLTRVRLTMPYLIRFASPLCGCQGACAARGGRETGRAGAHLFTAPTAACAGSGAGLSAPRGNCYYIHIRRRQSINLIGCARQSSCRRPDPLPKVSPGEGVPTALLQVALEGLRLRAILKVNGYHNLPRSVLGRYAATCPRCAPPSGAAPPQPIPHTAAWDL